MREDRISRRELRMQQRELEQEKKSEAGKHGCVWQVLTAPFRLIWWFIKDVLFFWAWWL